MDNYPSNVNTRAVSGLGLLRLGYLLVLAVTASSLGCIGTPHCEPCQNVCLPAPDCYGYYQTCWRPWPCPDRCPSIWDYGAGEAGYPEHGMPLESVPDPTSMPLEEPSMSDIPVIEDTSHYQALPTHPHPLFLADEAGNVTMLPQPGSPVAQQPFVTNATWPQSDGTYVIPTGAEQTPIPSRAPGAFDYFQQ